MKSKRMKAKLLTAIIILSIFAIAIPIVIANGSVINIDTAETFSTIQAAIDDSDTLAGHTIEVAAGTYSSSTNGEVFPLTVSKSLTLKGAQFGVDPTVPGSRTEESEESVIDASGATCNAIEITANDVTVDGFTIKNAAIDVKYAISVVPPTSDHSIYSSGIAIQNNILTGNNRGMKLVDNENSLVRKNRIVNCNTLPTTGQGGSGIVLSYVKSTTQVTENLLSENVAGNTYYGPILVMYGRQYTQPTITKNRITNNHRNCPASWGILVLDASAIIRDNLIKENDMRGIGTMWGTADIPTILIEDNFIVGNTQRGIEITVGTFAVSVTGNTIWGNGDTGIDVQSGITTDVVVHYNDIFDNGVTTGFAGISSPTNPVDATLNWWGTSVEGEIVAMVSGDVDYDSWLTARVPMTLHVPAPYGTIQAAIDAAEPGDTIMVYPGTYEEGDLLIDMPLTIQGAGKSDTVIDASGFSHGLLIAADDVTIEGLTVEGATDRDIVWYTVTVSGTTIRDVEMSDAGSAGLEVHHSTVTDILVEDCDFTGNNFGLHFSSGITVTGFTVDGCTFDNHIGIYTESGISGMTVTGSSFTDDFGMEMGLPATFENIYIEDSTFDSTDYGIYFWAYPGGEAENVHINYCSFINNAVGVEFEDNGLAGYESVVIDATMNWWGDATGPDHASNPHTTTQGAPVSDKIDFTPWYATPTTTPERQFVTVEHSSDLAYSDTIQGGIYASCPGDTVLINPGVYDEGNLLIDVPLTIQGAGKSDTIIDTGGSHGFDIEADDVTIKYLTIQSDVTGNNIHIDETVSDLTIDNVESLDANYGLEVHNNGDITNLVITNSLFSGCTASGMRIRGKVNGLTIVDSHFDNNEQGMGIYGSADNVVITGSTFNDNDATGSDPWTGGFGIYAGYWAPRTPPCTITNWVISDCQFNDNDGHELGVGFNHGIVFDADGTVISDISISDSEFLGNDNVGIEISSDDPISSISIDSCEFSGSLVAVLTEGESISDLSIHHSDILGNTLYGIYNDALDLVVDATENWWGTTEINEITDILSGNVLFAPWLDELGIPVETATSEFIEEDEGTIDATEEADTEVEYEATEPTTITVSSYEENPEQGFSNDAGKYYDVYVEEPAAVESLTLKFYYTDADLGGRDESTLTMLWYDSDTSAWLPCSHQTLYTVSDISGYSGYIEILVTDSTYPNLEDLSELPFGVEGEWPEVAEELCDLSVSGEVIVEAAEDVTYVYASRGDTAEITVELGLEGYHGDIYFTLYKKVDGGLAYIDEIRTVYGIELKGSRTASWVVDQSPGTYVVWINIDLMEKVQLTGLDEALHIGPIEVVIT